MFGEFTKDTAHCTDNKYKCTDNSAIAKHTRTTMHKVNMKKFYIEP